MAWHVHGNIFTSWWANGLNGFKRKSKKKKSKCISNFINFLLPLGSGNKMNGVCSMCMLVVKRFLIININSARKRRKITIFRFCTICYRIFFLLKNINRNNDYVHAYGRPRRFCFEYTRDKRSQGIKNNCLFSVFILFPNSFIFFSLISQLHWPNLTFWFFTGFKYLIRYVSLIILG